MTIPELAPATRGSGRCRPPRRTPYLVLDVDLALSRFRTGSCRGVRPVRCALRRQGQPAPGADPGPRRDRSRFDVASSGEVDPCLAAGAPAQQLLTPTR